MLVASRLLAVLRCVLVDSVLSLRVVAPAVSMLLCTSLVPWSPRSLPSRWPA